MEKAEKPKGQAKAKASSARTAFQRFETREIERAAITNAPYNPRRITADARERLKAKISAVGLVNVLVWNQRTGNLVSGHQRLSILDELEGGSSYSLVVSVVDVDERTEKELNVFVNNAGAMGDWNSLALGELAAEFKDDLAGLGFAPGELDHITNAARTLDEPPAVPDEDKAPRETQDGRQVLVVFRDATETDAFLELIGHPKSTRYIDGPKFFAAFGFTPKSV